MSSASHAFSRACTQRGMGRPNISPAHPPRPSGSVSNRGVNCFKECCRSHAQCGGALTETCETDFCGDGACCEKGVGANGGPCGGLIGCDGHKCCTDKPPLWIQPDPPPPPSPPPPPPHPPPPQPLPWRLPPVPSEYHHPGSLQALLPRPIPPFVDGGLPMGLVGRIANGSNSDNDLRLHGEPVVVAPTLWALKVLVEPDPVWPMVGSAVIVSALGGLLGGVLVLVFSTLRRRARCSSPRVSFGSTGRHTQLQQVEPEDAMFAFGSGPRINLAHGHAPEL